MEKEAYLSIIMLSALIGRYSWYWKLISVYASGLVLINWIASYFHQRCSCCVSTVTFQAVFSFRVSSYHANNIRLLTSSTISHTDTLTYQRPCQQATFSRRKEKQTRKLPTMDGRTASKAASAKWTRCHTCERNNTLHTRFPCEHNSRRYILP